MNDQSQIGITIAGVAVVSALAAVVFNRLNTEPRFSRSSSEYLDGYDEKYRDSDPLRSSSGVNPLDAVDVPWSDFNRQKRQEIQSDDEFHDAMGSNSSSQRSSKLLGSPERPSQISSLGASTGSSSGFSQDLSQDLSERPSQNDSLFESFDEQPSSTTPEGPPPPLPETPPGQQGQAPGQQPGMSGGARLTRCKHCHSRIKYTRRR